MCYFSDSLSALQALLNPDSSDLIQEIMYLKHQLSNMGIHVSLVWIPSHVGIIGNEIVDKLAKESLDSVHIDIPITVVLKIYSSL